VLNSKLVADSHHNAVDYIEDSYR